VIRAILSSLGVPSEAPAVAAARDPPELLSWEAGARASAAHDGPAHPGQPAGRLVTGDKAR